MSCSSVGGLSGGVSGGVSSNNVTSSVSGGVSNGSRSSDDLTLGKFSFKRSFGVVNNLSFDWNVFVLFNFSLLGNVLDFFFRDVLRNVLSQIFNGIIVSNGDFSWNFLNSSFFSVLSDFSSLWDSLNSRFLSVFNDFLFERNVFDSAFTLDDFFTSVDNGVNNLGLLDSSCGSVGGVASNMIGGISSVV